MIVNSPKKWTKVTLNSKSYLVVILRYFKLHIEETRKNVTTIKRQNHDTVASIVIVYLVIVGSLVIVDVFR